jgi:rod shape-determining protein MreC
MSRRPILFSEVAKPLRNLWQRFSIWGLVGVSLFLMISDQAGVATIKQFKSSVLDIMGIFLEVGTQSTSIIRNNLDTLKQISNLKNELNRLKTENQLLSDWKHKAGALASQNEALRNLHNFIPLPVADPISGRVIASSGGVFTKSVLINIGKINGAEIGQAVISGVALIGVIVETGNKFSRVLLITDLNSQVPVRIQNTGDPGILMGDNSKMASLFFLPQNSAISEGDIVVTSGGGGVLPPDLPIGIVRRGSGALFDVEPFEDWSNLSYIKVLNYKFDGAILAK